MIIDQDLCIGCEECIPYCIADAITMVDEIAVIDRDECLECGVCLQVGVCGTDAIIMDELVWPRLVRRTYSNVLFAHPSTGMIGRGTEEMKTNDVTGEFQRGEVGLGIEVGRPDVGTTFRDVDKIARALAKVGVTFAPKSPATMLMEDVSKGSIRRDVWDEKTICVILECRASREILPEVFAALSEVAKEIDTVFSVDLVTVPEHDGSVPNADIARRLGYEVRPNAKATVGLGRPLAEMK